MYNNNDYYYQNSSNESVQQQAPSSSNDNSQLELNNQVSYNTNYNYYDNQQYTTYNNQFYNNSYPYSTYYQNSFNNYQYQYNFNQVADSQADKVNETIPVYPTSYTYNPQVNANNKPTTPVPNVVYDQQSSTQSEQTPEKPVMNDSGVELISPQIVNSSYNASNISTVSVSESTKPTQVQQIQYPTLPAYQFNSLVNNVDTNSPVSSGQQIQKEDVKTLNDATNENNTNIQNDMSVEDEEEDEDEDLDESKENKKSKSKKSTDDSSSNNPSKPPKPYLEIIADAILSSKVKMMQLHEIYYFMEAKYEYFAKNVNKSWRNSVRHNLSLNECFVKAGRGYNGKGNYWKIHNLCEKEFIRGNFRRKSFKQAIRAGSSSSQSQTSNNNSNQVNNFPYTLPIDYSNFRSLLPPPPLSQQFLNKTGTFQYPITAYQQQQQHHSQQITSYNTKLSETTTQPSFNPYRV